MSRSSSSGPSAARTLLGEILEGDPLTERELEVLEHMAAGLTAAESGSELYLSGETVKGYRKRVVAKLGARNGSNAVALGFRQRLIT